MDRRACSEPDTAPPGECREVSCFLHFSLRTEDAYCDWNRRFVTSSKRHPKQMGEPEVRGFLTYLATERKVAASSQNQALNALVFLYQKVLRQEQSWTGDFERARRNRFQGWDDSIRFDSQGPADEPTLGSDTKSRWDLRGLSRLRANCCTIEEFINARMAAGWRSSPVWIWGQAVPTPWRSEVQGFKARNFLRRNSHHWPARVRSSDFVRHPRLCK